MFQENPAQDTFQQNDGINARYDIQSFKIKFNLCERNLKETHYAFSFSVL